VNIIFKTEAHQNLSRSTMSEERLSELAVLSIENEHAKKLDTVCKSGGYVCQESA